MVNLPTKNKHILRKVILCILAIPALFILYIVGAILLSPVFDAVEKTKFDQMDSQSRVIFNALQAASGGAEQWTYEASCEDVSQGGFQTFPDYRCSTTSKTELPATSPQQLSLLHEKYFPIIDKSLLLVTQTALDKQRPNEFGVDFVVSSAEKTYQLVKGGQTCNYLAKLAQAYDVTKNYNYLYGSPIEPGSKVIVSLECSAITSKNWYESSY